jgi:hypothetical protein
MPNLYKYFIKQNLVDPEIGMPTGEQAYSVLRYSDQACIPPDPRNRDYAEVLEHLANGGEIDPPDPEPEFVVPTPAEKLANAGLTVDELKTLLGLS